MRLKSALAGLLAALLMDGPASAAGKARAGVGTGRGSASFLRMPTSPRSVAMGEAGTGLADDALSAMAVNPAGLARLAYPEGAFSYNKLYEDLSLQSLAFAYPTKDWGTFGVAASLLQVKNFQGFDNFGTKVGEVRAMDLAAMPVFARRILGPPDDRRWGLFGGIGLKFVRSELEVARSNAVMGDAGLLFAHPLGPGVVTAGISGHSLGRGFKFDSVREKAPAVYRGGLGYSLTILGDPLTFVYDLRRPSDEQVTHGAGLEYSVRRFMSWRGGFITRQDLGQGYRFGVGFRVKALSVDYALSHFGRFGYTHLMAVSTRFGEPVEITPMLSRGEEKARRRIQRGKAFMKEGRGLEAAVEFDEALKLDPLNKEALEQLRQVKEGLERAQ